MTDRPTPMQVRSAKKAELLAWCESLGLSAEGKVEELRTRLFAYLESPPEPESPPADTASDAEEAPAAEGEQVKEEVEEEAEEEDREKAEAHAPRLKPTLDPAVRRTLDVRRAIAGRRPRFLRQEWFRHARLGMKWRKPKGNQTKLRRHFGYRPNVVSIGYRGPKAVRGLHPSGFREVIVHTLGDLERIDPKVEAARIGATVGMRRRTEIQAAADEQGIRVLNRREEE